MAGERPPVGAIEADCAFPLLAEGVLMPPVPVELTLAVAACHHHQKKD